MHNNKGYYASQPTPPYANNSPGFVSSNQPNRHSSPLRYRSPHRDEQKPVSHISQPIGYDYRSGNSRLKDINDRLAHDTEQIRWRNEAKRASKYDVRSTSSEMKRSRLSENNRRVNAYAEFERVPSRNQLPFKF